MAALVAEAPGEIARLAARGARLERTALHLEGGHSRSRIVSAGGDAIGAEVHRVLRAALLASRVQVLTHCVVLDALTGDRGGVGGVVAGIAGQDGVLRVGTVTAAAVVLATGGFGQAYATTTNPAGLTGDGLALAARAGAELRDVEFVQFHPTVLWQDGARGQCPLITEALRGAGGGAGGRGGPPGHGPAAIRSATWRRGTLWRRPCSSGWPGGQQGCGQQGCGPQGTDGPDDHLWLDATAVGRAVLDLDFPTVVRLCRARGIYLGADPIPVAPGAHYACGGIRAGLDTRTSVPGLYAVGEAASTGVHGANRLASNSLTEALITGRRTGELLGRELPEPPARLRLPPAGPGTNPAALPLRAAAMSRHAGVVRDHEGLESLRQTLAQARPAAGRPDLATVEATNLHVVSVLVTTAALARTESRGCHLWRDAPPVTPADPGLAHRGPRGGRPAVGGRGRPGRSGSRPRMTGDVELTGDVKMTGDVDVRPGVCWPRDWTRGTSVGWYAARSTRTSATVPTSPRPRPRRRAPRPWPGSWPGSPACWPCFPVALAVLDAAGLSAPEAAQPRRCGRRPDRRGERGAADRCPAPRTARRGNGPG